MTNGVGIAAITVALLLCLTGPAAGQAPDLQITASPLVLHVTNNVAIIQWSTNIPASALVRYGMDRNHLNQVAESAGKGELHEVQLHSLRSGTTYFYQVVSSANGIRAITYVDQFSTTGNFVLFYTEPSIPPSQ